MKEEIKQQEVINSNDNLLVLASAGCGKTTTIINKVNKIYHAVVIGKVNEQDRLEDYLLKNSKLNKSYIDNKGKLSLLEYELVKYIDDYSLVKIKLITGRSHQIRVQFSSRNHPLYGDQKYNNNAIVGEQICLYASSLNFFHPTTKEELNFSLPIPKISKFKAFI